MPLVEKVVPCLDSTFLGRRLAQLYAGLALYGLSVALMVRSQLGLNPWGVLHQGIARQVGMTLGSVTTVVAVAVLALWIPLRQRPGLGTVSNALLVGVATDGSLALLPPIHALDARVALLLAAVVCNGVASACYIGAGFGPGPRDGLMTGWVARFGGSVRLVRTGLEALVLGTGWLLGGTVGVGTVVYAGGIGAVVQRFLPMFTQRSRQGEPAQPRSKSSRT